VLTACALVIEIAEFGENAMSCSAAALRMNHGSTRSGTKPFSVAARFQFASLASTVCSSFGDNS
jgi:hypothetical protein